MSRSTVCGNISIVIPCYNRENLIGSTIDSAIANGEGAEIIVIDDGSTDSSWQRIVSYGNVIRSYRIPNGGVSTARNFGLSKATGQYIKFIDSDDLLPPGALTALYEVARGFRFQEIVFGDAVSVDGSGRIISCDSYGYSTVACPGPISLAELLSATMSPLLPLFPTKLLREVGGFDAAYSLGEDQELAVRLMTGGATFVRIANVVAHVREHNGARLSRSDPHALYARHVLLHKRLVKLLHEIAHNDKPARAALSRQILCSARDAARAQVRPAAGQLFELIQRWPDVDPTPLYLRLPYRMFGPYRTEQYLTMIKRLRDAAIR